MKERSEKNKINRAKYTFFHTIRSKTSVEIREEEVRKLVKDNFPCAFVGKLVELILHILILIEDEEC